MTWLVLIIRKATQGPPICSLMAIILASSSAVNYLDIIKFNFFHITVKLLLSHHSYFPTMIFFLVFHYFLSLSWWKHLSLRTVTVNSLNKHLYVVDTSAQTFTCGRCCSVPPECPLEPRPSFSQIL